MATNKSLIRRLRMKPYGRIRNLKFPGKTDYRLPKGYINWWENECAYVSRGRLNQIIKQEIEEELQEWEEENENL